MPWVLLGGVALRHGAAWGHLPRESLLGVLLGRVPVVSTRVSLRRHPRHPRVSLRGLGVAARVSLRRLSGHTGIALLRRHVALCVACRCLSRRRRPWLRRGRRGGDGNVIESAKAGHFGGRGLWRARGIGCSRSGVLRRPCLDERHRRGWCSGCRRGTKLVEACSRRR